MPDPAPRFPVFRAVAVVAVMGLFAADYAFGVMAKPPPWWAYAVPGLLALGIEARAVGRLIMQLVRGVARVPPDKGDGE